MPGGGRCLGASLVTRGRAAGPEHERGARADYASGAVRGGVGGGEVCVGGVTHPTRARKRSAQAARQDGRPRVQRAPGPAAPSTAARGSLRFCLADGGHQARRREQGARGRGQRGGRARMAPAAAGAGRRHVNFRAAAACALASAFVWHTPGLLACLWHATDPIACILAVQTPRTPVAKPTTSADGGGWRADAGRAAVAQPRATGCGGGPGITPGSVLEHTREGSEAPPTCRRCRPPLPPARRAGRHHCPRCPVHIAHASGF